jgi:hypothetical protein
LNQLGQSDPAALARCREQGVLTVVGVLEHPRSLLNRRLALDTMAHAARAEVAYDDCSAGFRKCCLPRAP